MRMSTVVALGMLGVLSIARDGRAGSMPERRVPMLVPKTDHEVVRAQVYAAFPRAEGRWGAVHVVDRTCSVSRGVIAHLVARRASAELDELVIVIGDGVTRREDVELVHAGYRVRVVSRTNASIVVPAVTPMMLVARPDGALAYAGGHRATTAAPRDGGFIDTAPRDGGFIDTTVMSDLVATGVTEAAAPVVGCASESTTLVASYTARTMQ